MDNVNRTLYIPLYGKSYVSRRGLFLRDEKAEAIWDAEGFPLKGKAKSKWLAYNMGMRAAVFDRWLAEKMEQNPETVILHIGCGMDSRAERVGTRGHLWFDIDFPEVIRERRKYFSETEAYRMIAADVREEGWMDSLPGKRPAIVVMEGVSMYLKKEDLLELLSRLKRRFSRVGLLMDCYTVFAAKATKYKNPINQVGVTEVYGIDDSSELTEGTGYRFVSEHDLTPEDMIALLPGGQRAFFRVMFAGKAAKGIYRLYEYEALGQKS